MCVCVCVCVCVRASTANMWRVCEKGGGGIMTSTSKVPVEERIYSLCSASKGAYNHFMAIIICVLQSYRFIRPNNFKSSQACSQCSYTARPYDNYMILLLINLKIIFLCLPQHIVCYIVISQLIYFCLFIFLFKKKLSI